MKHKRTKIGLAIAAALGSAAVVTLPAAHASEPGTRGSATAAAAVSSAGVGGTAWGTDSSGTLVVTADASVSKSDLAKLTKATAGYDNVRINRTKGTFRPLLAAGDAIYGGQYRCSLGFNVVSGGTYYFLTAGHCGKVANTWYTNSAHTTLIGPTISASFPGNDYALVRYDNASLSHPGGFTAADATVGEKVTRKGSTSGTHSGTVTALNVTVHYQGGGTVGGLIQTTVCAEPGDSGGPLYDGTKGLGITSGGSGDCTSGGTTFFQPVKEALSAYGVSLY